MSGSEQQSLEAWLGRAKKISFSWFVSILLAMGVPAFGTWQSSQQFRMTTTAFIEAQSEITKSLKADDQHMQEELTELKAQTTAMQKVAEINSRRLEIIEQHIMK